MQVQQMARTATSLRLQGQHSKVHRLEERCSCREAGGRRIVENPPNRQSSCCTDVLARRDPPFTCSSRLHPSTLHVLSLNHSISCFVSEVYWKLNLTVHEKVYYAVKLRRWLRPSSVNNMSLVFRTVSSNGTSCKMMSCETISLSAFSASSSIYNFITKIDTYEPSRLRDRSSDDHRRFAYSCPKAFANEAVNTRNVRRTAKKEVTGPETSTTNTHGS